MIYTKAGNEVTILPPNQDTRESGLTRAIRKTDNKERLYSVVELRADGGLQEIVNARNEAGYPHH